MDPDEALRQLREAIATLNQDDHRREIAAEQVVDHFQALDEWLSRGGFLPKAWGAAVPDPAPTGPGAWPDEE